jgi:ribonuclease HI
MGVDEEHHEQFLNNNSKLPAWTPGYVRENTIWVLHNSHFTAARMGYTNSSCPLCGCGTDSLPHLYNHCTTAKAAASKIWSSLGSLRSLSLTASISADTELESQECLVQAMLTTAIWRARSNAVLGMQRSEEAWATWIYQDILNRIVKHRPNFFNEHYQTARVSNAYRVNFRASIGSSKGTAEEKARAQQVISHHVNSLPAADAYAFTDGSAAPNPGPCGAGAIITHRDNSTPLTAYLGHGTNNIGELYAVGMVIDHFHAERQQCNIHIYTDSKMVHDALSFGWAAGKDNRELLKQVRNTIRRYKTTGGNVLFHWVPGHSGICGNEAADKLAGAGTHYSETHCIGTLDLATIVKNNTFLSQLVR